MPHTSIDGIIEYNGRIIIDQLNGTVIFEATPGVRVLRITHLPKPIPEGFGIDLVAIKNVTSYTPLEPREEAPPLGERPCDTCHKVHADIDEVVMIGKRGLYVGHEYIIETKTGRQKYPRRWRMGYGGRGMDRFHLTFSARGPDRTHSDQYAGDVTLDIREILGIQQVPKDVALRHTGQEVRAGGKAT